MASGVRRLAPRQAVHLEMWGFPDISLSNQLDRIDLIRLFSIRHVLSEDS
jgi:hypothetical protein